MSFNKWLHRYAVLTSSCTVILLCAGALVTSTGSGLAVPDWPLSYGSLFPPMIGGILFEHGHRLIAGTVAILTVIQAFLFARHEKRSWVRKIAWSAVGTVLLQASLGGLTVLLRLPSSVSVAHACLAQIFFCLTVVMALVTSRTWMSPFKKIDFSQDFLISVPTSALLISCVFFLQLLMGATMWHTGAGLAIPDFPAAFGGFIPPEFNPKIAIHFAHRMGAFLLVFLVALQASRIFRKYPTEFGLIAFSGALAALVGFQILMGAMVIWLKRPVPLTTLHLAIGALCLGTSVALTCSAFRLREDSTQPSLTPSMVPA